VENQIFRFKKILGGTLSSRIFANQITEAKIKTLILKNFKFKYSNMFLKLYNKS